MLFNNCNVLVLSPHTDDGELGCGGTISKLIENACKVKYVAFSICEESVPEEFPKDILEREVISATSKLGISSEDLVVHKFPVRYFPDHRQEILELLVGINKGFSPDLVFCPSSSDIHQDHSVIHQEAKRAFKKTSILGYEFIWNSFSFGSSLFVKLDKRHVQKKIDAISEYKSQAHKSYTQGKEAILGGAGFRGLQISTEYAEAFEAIRIIYE